MSTKIREERLWDARFVRMMKKLAPGTALRDGLDNVLRAKMGALVLLDDSPEALHVVDCGFALNADYTPASFYELAKMDGALVLSSDGRKILFANAQLVPDPDIVTAETGTRHRTAERVAKQTGSLVVAISQRRNIITMYLGNLRYTLKDIPFILARANQALQTLERYKQVLGRSLLNLNALEFEDLVTLDDVAEVLIRAERANRIIQEVEQDIIEMGIEGRLVGMQMEDMLPASDEVWNLIQDYCIHPDSKSHIGAKSQLASLPEENLERHVVGKLLGYGVTPNTMDVPVMPRGYRILRQIPRLPSLVVDNLVNHFKTLTKVYNASAEELDEVDGVGDARARTIREGLKRLREQTLFDRHL